ncbi:MAG: CDP-alcohol phosphatidyltransferase family protein [Promethearchaeia archaeon]
MSKENIQEAKKKRESQRNTLDKFLDWPVNFLIEHNVTPNLLSYIGLTCIIIGAFFLSIKGIYYPIWIAWPAPFFIFLGGTFDVFDGEVARRTGQESPAGAFLDSNLDRISDAVIIMGLIFGGFISYITGFLILFLTIMISYIRSRAESEGVEMKGVGLMERAERILVVFGAIIIEIWAYFFIMNFTRDPLLIKISFINTTPLTPFFFGFIFLYIFLLVLTVGQRIQFAFNWLNE